MDQVYSIKTNTFYHTTIYPNFVRYKKKADVISANWNKSKILSTVVFLYLFLIIITLSDFSCKVCFFEIIICTKMQSLKKWLTSNKITKEEN